CDVEQVPGMFNLITMVHVLEHIPSPHTFLRRVINKLEPAGLLLIEVPDHHSNPFDLLIADHCSHFTSGAMRQTLSRAGLTDSLITTQWVAKELSTLASVPV